MRYIDMEHDPRQTHYAYFKSLAYPYVGVTANVDVTGPVAYAKARGGSTFLACLWVAVRAANQVPQLRQRIAGDRVVEYDYCQSAHTVAMPDHTFCNCRTDSRLPLDEFLVHGKQRQCEAMGQHGFLATQEDETSLIFVSCVPWIEFTQVIQPAPIPADSSPRIVMGKYIPQGERTLMPLHIQCNHALVDGYHLGRFYAAFEELCQGLIGPPAQGG